MKTEINMDKLSCLGTADELLNTKYGFRGTPDRDSFDARAKAWYYAEVLKKTRKAAGITQLQLAQRIGKEREYIASFEKGETDMQLSTFLMISEALGLRFTLV